MLPALSRIVALAIAVALITSFSSNVVVPNFPDLAIKTRMTLATNAVIHTASYFKGPRQRTEHTFESSGQPTSVTLTQCDQGSDFFLDVQKKTYVTRPVDPTQWKDARKIPQQSSDTAEVIVTTDSVDTGDRRSVGSYEAHRVKTTTTIEADKEAGVSASKMETDGWYINLPGWNCRDDSGQGQGIAMFSVGRRIPRYVFRQLGSAHRGFAIDETTVTTQSGRTTTSRTEFLEISEDPLDPRLFEVPADYTLVTRTPER